MKCQICGEVATQKHHISYFPEKTITVCAICHNQIHLGKIPQYLHYKKGDPNFFYSMKKRLRRRGIKL